MDKFDSCARKSFADEQATIKSGAFLPSLAFGNLQSPVTAGAITDVVTNFMNSNEDPKEGVRKLAAAAKVQSAGVAWRPVWNEWVRSWLRSKCFSTYSARQRR